MPAVFTLADVTVQFPARVEGTGAGDGLGMAMQADIRSAARRGGVIRAAFLKIISPLSVLAFRRGC
jgi:hypothetical protein